MMSRSLCVLIAVLLAFHESSGVPAVRRVLRQTEDNCNHPFHSFLCHKAPRSRVVQAASSVIDSVKLKPPQPKFSGEESLLDPTFIIKQTTTAAPVKQPEPTGDSSIGDPVFVRPTQPPAPPPTPYVAQAAVANEARVKPQQDPDLCAHSFHSFLCQPSKPNRRRIYNGKLLLPTFIENSVLKAVPIKTTKAPPPPSPEPNLEVPEASFQSPSFYKPQPVKIVTTPKPLPPVTQIRYTPPLFTPTRPRPTLPPPQPETPDASADSPSFLRPDPVRTTPPPVRQVFTAAPQNIVTVRAEAEHYKGQNACDHAFHSYLCQPAKSRRRNYGRLPEQAAASFQQNYIARVTTTTTAKPVEVKEYSELLPAYRTTKAPLTTQPPTTRAPTTVRITTTRRPIPTTVRIETTRRPIPTAVRITTTPRPTTTTQPPIEPAPSSSIFSGVLPPRPLEPAANTVNSRVQLIEPDLCKHAFHSFLCQPARPRKIKLQPRPAPSVIEESLLLPAYRTTARPTTQPPPSTTRAPVTYRTTTQPPPITTRAPLPSTTRPPPPKTTTTEREQNVEVPDSSFQDPQRILPPRPAAATVQNIILPVQHHSHDDDLCNHPFHSFLCHKTVRARRPIRIK